ncbi:inovirus-type Gp2 protein [Acinetobacter baumannii]|uniref:inovirus-type Gp2 protein n=1 Tax=Acinetobacter baumannii TaxID=470 RepID=UPI0002CDB873|nr:inovirus-type Gp2 protein [Acinetobacter baumannii]ENU70086.1 hypothetical protein F978_01517 [Acinetobacter baumannii NIPH 615]MCR8954595.1 inovirus-type Gp2 protein [Acinetobacter baumannii]
MSVDDRSEARDSKVLDFILACFERKLAKERIDWKRETGLRDELYYWVGFDLPEFANTYRMWHWLLNLPDREYCPRIQLFSNCFHAHFNGYTDEDRIRALEENLYGHLPHILVQFAYGLNTKSYKRQAADTAYQVKQRQAVLKSQIDTLLSQYSRILPYRFDLYYYDEFKDEVSSLEFRQHLDEFSRQIRKTCNFAEEGKQDVEILFFARLAEQGAETGHYHVHYLIILDGKYHRNVYRFRTVADALWRQITEGKGYLSYYQGETSYGRSNISNRVIHRDETEYIESLYFAANYLAKNGTDSGKDQYLRCKPKGMELFACSHRKK